MHAEQGQCIIAFTTVLHMCEWCFYVCEDITVRQNDKIEGVKSTWKNSPRNVEQ